MEHTLLILNMGYEGLSSRMQHHWAPLNPCKECLHSSSIAMLIIQFTNASLSKKYEHLQDSKPMDLSQVKLS